MRFQQLTVVAFCHVVLASIVLYSTTFASPLCDKSKELNAATVVGVKEEQKAPVQVEAKALPPSEKSPEVAGKQVVAASQVVERVAAAPVVVAAPQKPSAVVHSQQKVVEESPQSIGLTERTSADKRPAADVGPKSVAPEQVAVVPKQPVESVAVVQQQAAPQVAVVQQQQQIVKEVVQRPPIDVGLTERSSEKKPADAEAAAIVLKSFAPEQKVEKEAAAIVKSKEQQKEKEPLVAKQEPLPAVAVEQKKAADVVEKPLVAAAAADKPILFEPLKQLVAVQQPVVAPAAALIASPEQVVEQKPVELKKIPVETAADESQLKQKSTFSADDVELPPLPAKGGLGPLHLLATTLCSYQPDKPVADEHLNQLYARRATVRKSLFEFMSLKFTNLEKLSSRLGYDLQVVPVKSISQSKTKSSGDSQPSHGWPVVGKCTAHDLKLMGEAAWCECNEAHCQQKEAGKQQAPVEGSSPSAAAAVSKKDVVLQNSSPRANSARSIGLAPAGAAFSPEQSSVISKILHVGDIKDAPIVESTFYNLNLTQQQLASLESQATSTRMCRRAALVYTQMLFEHLAEDQKSVSHTWPALYAFISADHCARKRMIDIVNALSSFRTDTTSIRRDNLEFAFAMDDLRVKVLESEVNVPLTFDKQFIEVEQFLQQSVRLMLSNIDPNRAKLTSMRYRSLMFGPASDDQCLDLHQRLLANTYPTDCNPTQFGQLPDVLRMTASSLELWSIEKDISMHKAKVVDYSNASTQQKVKADVNECIANLVSS